MAAPPDGPRSGALPVRPEQPVPRPLPEVVAGLAAPARGDAAGLAVTGCTLDSRAVAPGDLYAALPGARAHGADFAAQAVAAGAVAVLTDAAGAERVADAVPVLVADDPRQVLGEVARRVHGDPGAGMLLVGITGTNGKTTTAFLVEAGLRAAGHTTGLIGTVETRVAGETWTSVRTSPEAPDLHGLLAVMRERGVTAVASEVSSHALSLGRVDGVRYDVAGFTNLSQDHLDFHDNMEDYFAAKASLFAPTRSRYGVVDVDDAYGARLAATAGVPVTTVGTEGEWRADDVRLAADGSDYVVVGPGVRRTARVRLPGAFNVRNAMLATVALVRAGVDLDAAVEGVGSLPGVPGRMERVDAGQPFLALVDYAHTPDAVATLLATVRRLVAGRVIVVLGCGGDRDRAKRPLMGRAAVEGADIAILTSDNPRSEDPVAILDEVRQPGARVLVDRREAIAAAVAEARPGDAVVIAGKGHERGQEVAGVVHPFDDREVLREALTAVLA